MNDDHGQLWTRLERLVLDDPAVALPFSVRLARENGWSLRHAQRVIGEYKRFVFLAVTQGEPMCPSDAVDEAWHLHLCYTRSYWERLCRDTLGKPLHHEPTQGGRDQLEHHRAMYERTLAAYRAAFDREPPTDLWPSVDDRFAPADGVRVDRATHWIVPKLTPGRLAHSLRQVRRRFAQVAGATALAFVPIVGFTNPLNLTGPEFLALYVGLLLVGSLGGLALRRLLRTPDDATPLPTLDAYEAAILAGGEDRAVRVALSELVADGYVVVINQGSQTLTAATPVSSKHHPIVQAVHRAIVARVDATLADAYNGGRPVAAQYGAQLTDQGLLETAESASAARWAPALIMAAVVAIGVIKIIIGIDRLKPVEFLVVLSIVGAVFVWLFARRLPRTFRGERLLARLRAEHMRLKDPQQLVAEPVEAWPLGLGLFGLAALSMAPDSTATLYRWMHPRGAVGSTGCSGIHGGGCGGGGGGGCGGGGGGCGGGCGGCGGS
jgi:uncharacterized protein (TIGR04222 family)